MKHIRRVAIAAVLLIPIAAYAANRSTTCSPSCCPSCPTCPLCNHH